MGKVLKALLGDSRGELERLVDEGADLQSKLDNLNSRNSALSPKAAIAEAIRLGGDVKQADLVMATIAGGGEESIPLRGAFNRLCDMVRSFNRTSIIKPERTGNYIGNATEALGRLQISRSSMVLAVVRHLTQTEPALWGEMESPTAHADEIAKVKAEVADICRRIEAAIMLADLTVHPMADHDRQAGHSRVSFKLTNDEVFLGDGRDLGARLVSWALSQRMAKAA